MNETEKDRILRMLSEGTLKPTEAAQLLASLKEDKPAAAPAPEVKKEEEKAKQKAQQMEVQMQRPDGSSYSIEVPPNLLPMFVKLAGVAIRESARSAAADAWGGLKAMVRNKATEIKDNVTTKVRGGNGKTEVSVAPANPEEAQQQEARRRILQMVQNGRINAEDASRLIQQLDALQKEG